MISARHKFTVFAVLLAAVLLTFSAAPIVGANGVVEESPAYYSRLTTGLEAQPYIYLKFQGRQMWLAESLEKLETEAAISPDEEETSERFRQLHYPKVELPLKVEGILRISATFQIMQDLMTEAERLYPGPDGGRRIYYGNVTYEIERKDAAGNVWAYRMSGGFPILDKARVGQSFGMSGLLVDNLTISMDLSMRDGEVGIGLRATTGSSPLEGVTKNGEEVRCKVTVLDETGEPVMTKEGPLSDFGSG